MSWSSLGISKTSGVVSSQEKKVFGKHTRHKTKKTTGPAIKKRGCRGRYGNITLKLVVLATVYPFKMVSQIIDSEVRRVKLDKNCAGTSRKTIDRENTLETCPTRMNSR